MVRRSVMGAVLAGGAGRRIGGGKAAVELAGRPLLRYPLAVLTAVVGEVAVVAKRETPLPPLEPNVEVWLEPDAPQHPLVGVIEALRRARGRPVVVVAGDMPFLSVELLTALAREPARGAPAVVAEGDGRLQPFCARYEPAALERLEGFDPSASVTELVAALDPHLLPWPDPRPFFNVNRPEDVAQAEALLDVP